MARQAKTLEDLFHETLKDIYYAEKKILTALPKMAKAAQSDDLRAAFEKHENETEVQVERLEQVFDAIEQPARGKTCDAINGLIDESKELMKEFVEKVFPEILAAVPGSTGTGAGVGDASSAIIASRRSFACGLAGSAASCTAGTTYSAISV